jgi:ATP-dependent exoDNAse (exonuclease V) alpha subunit
MLHLHRSSSTFKSYGAEYRRWQLPILNAFALTIHKVQGLSLPSITLALNENVGLSQATTLEQVFLTQLDFRAIKADQEAITEYKRLRDMALQFKT